MGITIKKTKVLLSFVGSTDPSNPNSPYGPILSVADPVFREHNIAEFNLNEVAPKIRAAQHQFDEFILLYSDSTASDQSRYSFKQRAEDTAKLLIENGKQAATENLNIKDPVNYEEIVLKLTSLLDKKIRAEGKGKEYFASISSGTPVMHTCWFFLALSRQYPITLLYVRDPRYMGADQDYILTINPYVTINEREALRVTPTLAVDVNDFTAAMKHGEVIAASKALQDVYQRAFAVEKKGKNGCQEAVIIQGESGTGKEVLARFIHKNSARKDKPFIAVNCGAIPEALVESELFGHVKGAFTSALAENPGKFRLANHGTIFLDEIGELPKQSQVKLLRVLQEKEVTQVGGKKADPVDVRIIAATNADLKRMVREGRFREDLFYRLYVLDYTLPPLRQHREDIKPLIDFFLEELRQQYGVDKLLEDAALVKLLTYSWPGNVRELKNALHRAFAFSDGVITERHIEVEQDAPESRTIIEIAERLVASSIEHKYTDLKKQWERLFEAGICAYGEHAGLTQKQLAEALDTSPQTISDIKNKSRSTS